MTGSRTTVLFVSGVLAATLTGAGLSAPAPAAAATVTPCSRGLVALTFDDGPKSIITPKLLDVLRERRTPATFFVVGSRVSATPRITRRASRLGFVIGNHTYRHENLTSLGDGGIKLTLRRTQRAIRADGAKPSTLMRPPYGAINNRVRAAVRDVGLVPVLWTADPRDWAGGSASTITRSTLAQLRPHEPNVVLLHDGVGNSANTLAAVPRIIRGARTRGYCLAVLGAKGKPVPPVPLARVAGGSVRERPGGSVLKVVVALDRPTSRATSVRLRTVARSATPGADHARLDKRVRFPVGATRRVVRVRVRNDLRDERTERFGLRLSHTRGMKIARRLAVGRILDDDPPPQAVVVDAEVTEPAQGSVDAPVTVRLSRPSERWVRMTVATVPGTADEADFEPRERLLRFAPLQRKATFPVPVLADDAEEAAETFEVRVLDGVNVTVAGASGTVTIQPPPN